MNATRRRTVTESVHHEIDELTKLKVLTPQRAQKLKNRLTTAVIEQHVRDGMTTRDIIDMHNDLADPIGVNQPGSPQKRAVSPEETFAADVLACVDDLNAVLPRLASRYEDLVIVAALAEHVGGALRIFMQAGICNSEQARRVLKHLEDTAFATEPSVPPSE